MKKLAVITTHPIQYNAPFFQLLARSLDFNTKVFYTLGREASGFVDPGFGKNITWDIPLLEGYDYTFVRNVSKKPSTAHFKGIVSHDLIQQLVAYAPTHILVYGWSFDSHLQVMRYFRNKAFIMFRGDSTLLNETRGLKTVLRRLWLTWVYRHIDVAFYVGTNNKQYYEKHGISTDKLAWAPHAVDNDRFGDSSHEEKTAKIRRELGITDDKKVLLFIGKFEWQKDPVLLIKSFNNISTPDTVLVMVGNGALEKEIKDLAKYNERIKFLPFQNQSVMPAIYRLGDALVLPSVSETWGLSVNEAMASGVAVIASDKVGAAIDLIDDGWNGYIFKSGDIEDLANVLKSVSTTSKGELKRMGEASKLKIKTWSYQAAVSSIVDLICGSQSQSG